MNNPFLIDFEGYCLLTFESRFLFVSSFIIMGLALLMFEFTSKKRIAVFILMFAALLIGYLFASIDPFLYMWDEQFHVLVAKNLMDDPLKPMLYREAIHDFWYQGWSSNVIWLHKPPLFMWQMALSMSVFGVNEIAARLPDIFMHSVMVLFIYRIGSYSVNARTGFYAALLYAFAHFPLELITGWYVNDHNDKTFIFYITASFWALFEYKEKGDSRWVYLIGIFTGCAVLVKLLAGLLVFGPWFLSIIFLYKKDCFKIRLYFPIIKSLAICLIIVLLWNVYAIIKYPDEAIHELFYTASHLTETLEGKFGDYFFHIEAMKILFVNYNYIHYIILASIIILFFRVRKKEYYVIILSAIVAVYVIFTLACTKMESFTAIVSFLIFIAFSASIDYILTFIYRKRKSIIRNIVAFIVIAYLSFIVFDPSRSLSQHVSYDLSEFNFRNAKIREAIYFRKINEYLKGEKYVVYNADFNLWSHISGMFYTSYICYSFIPSVKQIEEAMNKGYKVAVLDLEGLPKHITNNPNVKVIKIFWYESFTWKK